MPSAKDATTFSVSLLATLGLFAASLFLPLVGILFLVFSPLPLIRYCAQNSYLRGMLLSFSVLAIAYVGLYALGYPNETLPFFILTSVGFAIGRSLSRGLAIEKTVVVGIFLITVPICLMWLLAALETNQSPYTILYQLMLKGIEESIALYKNQGFFAESINFLTENKEFLAGFITKVFPSILIGISLLIVVANSILGIRYAKIASSQLEALRLWKSPEAFVWLLIIATTASFFTEYFYVQTIGLNIAIVCMTIYALQGFAVLVFLFDHWRVPLFLRIALGILLVIQQYLLIGVSFLGLFDLWLNFRQRIKKRE